MSIVLRRVLSATANNLCKHNSFIHTKLINKPYSNMEDAEMKKIEMEIESNLTSLAPSLAVSSRYKGQAGKVGVIGGSIEYTGAPYFAAITALKTGADIVHVFCIKDAAIPIKCYSPEIIVHPFSVDGSVDTITQRLEALDVILIGPGLGREPKTLELIKKVIQFWKEKNKPLVLDADALFLIAQQPNLLKNFKANVILAPNSMELARLLHTTPAAVKNEDIGRFITDCGWDNVSILAKGEKDNIFSENKRMILQLGGSGRRCGGQGDLLAGALAVFLNWSKNVDQHPVFFAAYAACRLTRDCNERAFAKCGRSMMASDMIQEIHTSFDEHFEN